MKNYKVHLVIDAEYDLFEIYKFIATNDSKNIAIKIINNIENVCFSLKDYPDRGHLLDSF